MYPVGEGRHNPKETRRAAIEHVFAVSRPGLRLGEQNEGESVVSFPVMNIMISAPSRVPWGIQYNSLR